MDDQAVATAPATQAPRSPRSRSREGQTPSPNPQAPQAAHPTCRHRLCCGELYTPFRRGCNTFFTFPPAVSPQAIQPANPVRWLWQNGRISGAEGVITRFPHLVGGFPVDNFGLDSCGGRAQRCARAPIGTAKRQTAGCRLWHSDPRLGFRVPSGWAFTVLPNRKPRRPRQLPLGRHRAALPPTEHPRPSRLRIRPHCEPRGICPKLARLPGRDSRYAARPERRCSGDVADSRGGAKPPSRARVRRCRRGRSGCARTVRDGRHPAAGRVRSA